MPLNKPTEEAYAELQNAYDFYNARLFGDRLPPCLITLQREKATMGYFSSKRFVRLQDGRQTDEIAMNPAYFAIVPMTEVLQTLVHEMVHLWQQHFGRPSRTCYHNTQWANKMESLGLMPSETGQPGGKRTGQKMGDYVIPGARFERVTRELLESGFAISWLDRFPTRMLAVSTPEGAVAQSPQPTTAPQTNEQPLVAPSAYEAPAAVQPNLDLASRPSPNRSHRHKYTCSGCFLALWGRPGIRVKCVDCDILLMERAS